MIKSIKIENFQAHKELTLDFGRHITSITGPSDRGKSAIIRALIWVMTNRPSGDGFIRYGAEECRVSVKVGEHTVERIKGKKRNLYILDGIEFKALKTDVPEEIQKVFNINDNNIQSQFDPIFWFSETAGEVGRNLNQIVNLDIIDHVLGQFQSKMKQVKTELDIWDNMISEQEKILEGAEDIEAIATVADRVQTFQKQLQDIQKQAEKLDSIICQITNLTIWLENAKKWEETYRQLELLIEQYIDINSNVSSLQGLIRNIDSTTRIVEQNEVPDLLFAIIVKIETGYKDVKDLRAKWKGLNIMIKDIHAIRNVVHELEQQARQAEDKLHKTLNNNVCPLCGRGGER